MVSPPPLPPIGNPCDVPGNIASSASCGWHDAIAHRSLQGSTGGQAPGDHQIRPRVIEPRQSNGVPPEREAERVDSVAIESSDTGGVPIDIRFGGDAIQLGRSWRRGARSDEDLKRLVSEET